LIHLCDDVLRFGPLQNFSAYPFENFLQYLKKLLRMRNQSLQQIVKRVVELGKANLTKKIVKFDTRSRSFRLQHDSGPLIPNLVQNSMQYKEMYFGPWFLSCRVPDNCVYLADASVIRIENIINITDVKTISFLDVADIGWTSVDIDGTAYCISNGCYISSLNGADGHPTYIFRLTFLTNKTLIIKASYKLFLLIKIVFSYTHD
jgi:hypothetical protein